MPFIMGGLAIANGIMGFLGASSAAKAQSIINKANADASNTVRKADNEYRGAAAGLANYIRAEDTKRKFKMAGAEWNAAGQNIVRLHDAAVKGEAQVRIKAAEQLGELSAQASFMGIGGSTVDSINRQIRMASSDQIQQMDDQVRYQTGDIQAQRVNLFDNANAASDQGTTFAGLDYNKAIPEFVAKPSFLTYALSAATDALPYIRTGIGNMQMKKAQQQKTTSSYGFNNYAYNPIQ